MTSKSPSATPEGKPSDFLCDSCSHPHQVPSISVTTGPELGLVAALEAAAEVEHFAATGCRGRVRLAELVRRDALHAETVETLQAELAKADRGERYWTSEDGQREPTAKTFRAMWNGLRTKLAELRAALQHGEEREKVMLATLRSIGFDVRGEVTWCGSCGDLVDVCDADIERGGNCEGWDARRALAAAQAMKEGTPR